LLFHKAKNGAIANAQAGTKRSLSLWQRQEIQEVLRGVKRGQMARGVTV